MVKFRAIGFICALFASIATARGAEPKNVLLIVADDLRDALGCYGNAAVTTPNLDKLAARGVRFDRAYVQYPVCNPSRVSFLTGMRCEQTGVVNNNMLFRKRMGDVVTLPQMLRQEGWYTASYGKIFHTGESKGEVRAGWMDEERSWDEALMFDTTPAGTVIEGRNLTNGKLKWCEWGATAGTDDDQPDGQTAGHSVRLMEKLTAEKKPWLVAAGFNRPHDPFLVPAKYFDLYPTGSLTLHRDPADATPLKPLSIAGGAFAEAFDKFTDAERLEFLRAYYAGVSFMDAQVGRLMDTMDRLKLWDDTIVIFIGDHGYHLGERNWWNKNTLFERSCRVPLIVAAPDVKAGVCSGLVELLDLFPTITDYCGTEPPHPLAGKSLRPLVQAPSGKGREAAFTLVARGGRDYGQTVRTDNHRFIQWSDGQTELYDHRNDPEEFRNIADDPKNEATLTQLTQLLKKVGQPSHIAPQSKREQ